MRNVYTLIGCFAALLHLPCAAAPLPPDWQITRDETDWIGATALSPGLLLDGERVSLLLDSWDEQPPPDAATPRIWRWTLHPGTDTPELSSAAQTVQPLLGEVSMTASGYFLTRTSMDVPGASSTSTCGWVSLDASLQPRWSRMLTTTYLAEARACSRRAALSDGGAVVTVPTLQRIGANGAVRWELPWSAFGAPLQSQVQLAVTADGTLIVASQRPDTRVWVLDGQTGTIQSQLLVSRPIDHILAQRESPNGFELLISSQLDQGQTEISVLRRAPGTSTLAAAVLAEGPWASLAAYPHDQGYVLVDATQIRVFDGSHLRWSQAVPQALAGPNYAAVNAQGAVALALPGSIQRYSASGVVLAPIPWSLPHSQAFSMVLSGSGNVWIMQRFPFSAAVTHAAVIRIPVLAQAPDLQVPVRVPAQTTRAGGLDVEPNGHTHALLWRAATASTRIDGEWQHLEVDAQGRVLAEIRVPGPPPREIRRLGRSWVLLNQMSNQYAVWNPYTGEIQQHAASPGASVRCDAHQCLLAEPFLPQGPRLTRFDSQGTLQILQEPIEPILCHGPMLLRGLRETPHGQQELLAFTASAPQVLMTLPATSSSRYCQGNEILQQDGNGLLQRIGPQGVRWSTPLPAPAHIVQRNTRLYALSPALHHPDHTDLVQIDPDSGALVRQLPVPFRTQAHLLPQMGLETADERLLWITDGATGQLHAVHGDGRIVPTSTRRARLLQATHADQVMVLDHGNLAAYSVALFQDGLEDE